MHFVLQTPSLQHLAGVKIATHLWNQHLSYKHSPVEDFNDDESEFELMKYMVERDISALSLPDGCVQRLLGLVKPLKTEILVWGQYHNYEASREITFLDHSLPQQLRWTMHGTVDYAKTAALMVKDESLDLQKRFELACIHCLEDEARVLFERVAEERGEESVPVSRYVDREDLSQLILFFARSINLDVRGESMSLSDESSINKRLFEDSLISGNRAMCEYLFHALNQRQKEEVMEDCQMLLINYYQNHTGSLLYYLSSMNEEQQRHMFRECVIDLLIFLLRWPVQSIFVAAAKCGWRSMNNRACSDIFFNIVGKINDGYRDYAYAQLFWECWSLTPTAYKDFCLNKIGILDSLLLTKREEFILLVLNEAPCHQLERAFIQISRVLINESVISEAALMECAETAALESSNDEENLEKRLKSQCLTRLVEMVIDSRI